MKKIVLLASVSVLLFIAFLVSHMELRAEVERNLAIRVVDVMGDPVSNLEVLLIHVSEEGYTSHLPKERLSEEGTLEMMVAEGTYEYILYCEKGSIESSPYRFEVTEDMEVLVTAYLLTMTPPGTGGVVGMWGIRRTIGMFDMMNVSVAIKNYYELSKDVTLKVWILDSQSRKVSEASINTTIPGNTTALNRVTRSIALPPPKWGWWNGRYFIHAKIYDEQNVYREKSSSLRLNVPLVPHFWTDWRFWITITVGIIVLSEAVCFLKKRKSRQRKYQKKVGSTGDISTVVGVQI